MAKYTVVVPFTGYFCANVEASSVEEAKNRAFECNPFDDEIKDGSYVEELQYHEKVVDGNINGVVLNEIDVYEVLDG